MKCSLLFPWKDSDAVSQKMDVFMVEILAIEGKDGSLVKSFFKVLNIRSAESNTNCFYFVRGDRIPS